MSTDVFGEKISSLFDEFEKERFPRSSYIETDTDNGETDKDKSIVFHLGDFEPDSESSGSDLDSDSEPAKHDVQQVEDSQALSLPIRTSSDTSNEKQTFFNGDIKDGNTVEKQKSSNFDYNGEIVSKLAEERDKIRRYTRILDSTRHVGSDESPAIQIFFQNSKVSRKYRPQIEQYISCLIQKDTEEEQKEKLPELRLKPHALSTVQLNEDLSEGEYSHNLWASHAIIGCSQFFEAFILDLLGWPLVSNTPALTDGWEIPPYEQIYTKPLPCTPEQEDAGDGARRKQRPKACCFNCGEEHMLSDCPEPKDMNKIRQNRRVFLEQHSSSASLSRGMSSQSRYHIEDDPRFASFKPGNVSDELRDALGLKRHQLPSYIYKMRLLGYPPGWLKDVEEHMSGISMFDKHGQEVNLEGESLEDGETSHDRAECTLDPSKIIEYAGFTVAVPEGVRDEHERMDMPPIQPHQMKSNVENDINIQKKELKRRAEERATRGGKKSRTDSPNEDMDLESGTDMEMSTPHSARAFSFISPPPVPLETPPRNPPLPDGTPPITPTTSYGRTPSTGRVSRGSSRQSSVDRGSSSTDTSQADTPSESLEDLVNQHQSLMQALAAETDDQESDFTVVDSYDSRHDDSEEGEISSQEELQEGDTQELRDNDNDDQIVAGESNAEVSSQSPVPDPMSPSVANVTFKPCVSLSRDFGTPILQENSTPALPDPSKFGVGIEDHIPFENLPDATGTFSKIKGLIGKIREVVSVAKTPKQSKS